MEGDTLSAGAAGLIGGFLGMSIVVILLFCAAWYVLQVVAYWKIFTKAGKAGWLSLIPVVNTWNQIDLSWSRTVAWIWLALTVVTGFMSRNTNAAQQNGEAYTPNMAAAILGLILLVITVVGLYKLAKAFGKGFGFFIGLLLLNPIFMLILGFGDARYQGKQG